MIVFRASGGRSLAIVVFLRFPMHHRKMYYLDPQRKKRAGRKRKMQKELDG